MTIQATFTTLTLSVSLISGSWTLANAESTAGELPTLSPCRPTLFPCSSKRQPRYSPSHPFPLRRLPDGLPRILCGDTEAFLKRCPPRERRPPR